MLTNLFKHIYFRLGWKTKRKIIVFLSDDWGSTRVPSTEAREKLIKKGIKMDSNRFNKFDTLETNLDLEGLFNVLTAHKDSCGRHAVITAMTNVANPDFEVIGKSNFAEYAYEPFTKTLDRNKDSDKVFAYYHKGIEEGIFCPQFHGREHVNINRWLRDLRNNSRLSRSAFKHGFWGLDSSDVRMPKNGNYNQALNPDDETDLSSINKSVIDGLQLFEKLFGFSSSFFTPPAMYLPKKVEAILSMNGVRFLDTNKIRLVPIGNGKYNRKFHYLGQHGKNGITYIQRNAVFETNLMADPVETCLNDIANAFAFNKPAIISNHRASFVGSLDPINRDNGLKSLNLLLKKIVSKWPDIEFMNINSLQTEMQIKKHV